MASNERRNFVIPFAIKSIFKVEGSTAAQSVNVDAVVGAFGVE